jgi:putative peptidoglycan lipid II flippase
MNLGHVLLPYLSGQVAARDWSGLSRTVSLTTRLLLYVTVPVAAGLWLISEDLIQVILERGEFTHGDTMRVMRTLRAYAWGLLFAGLSVVLTKVFNAMQRVRAIFVVSAVAFAAKIVANALLRGPLGAPGIAFGTALFYAISFVMLAIWLRRTSPLKLETSVLRVLVITLAGGAVMVAAGLAARAAMLSAGWPAAIALTAEIALGIAVWILWSVVARLPELGMIWRLLVRWNRDSEGSPPDTPSPSPV